MKKNFLYYIPLLLIVFFFTSCSTTKNAEQINKKLLIKNSINVDHSYIETGDLSSLTAQKPIKGITSSFFRPGIWFYKKSMQGKETRFKKFKRKAFGQEPVYFDSAYINETLNSFDLFLKNKGFFHSELDYSVKLKKNTAKVYYKIKAGEPCIVDTIIYNIEDTNALNIITKNLSDSKIKKKMIFDTYLFNEERNHISDLMQNNGYYSVSQNDVFYVVDMSEDKLNANAEVMLKKYRTINDSTGEIIEMNHPLFYIKNIRIETNAQPSLKDNIATDSLDVSYKTRRKSPYTHKTTLYWNDKLTLRPSVLTSILQFHDGQLYSKRQTNNTYKRLIKLPIIKSTGITMQQIPNSVNDSNFLDCNIKLLHNKNKIFNIGLEGTNSSGKLGMGVKGGFTHKNIFKGAEVLTFNIRTSAEIQPFTENITEDNFFLIFNTLEAAAEVSLAFPRILLPLKLTSGWGVQEANSSLNLGMGYEFRPQYTRNLSTLSWNYNWQFNQKLKHTFTPIEFNYINVLFISDDFKSYLDSLSDPHYRSIFTSHLLTTIRYNFVLTNNYDTKLKNQYFFRYNVETSGNINYLIDKSFRKLPNPGEYQRFGVHYAQFFRTDFDYRRYWYSSNKNTLVFRFLAGISVPYGNSKVVPFEKSFWLGGANDMRGWKLRSLGPGSYVSEKSSFDQSGNIVLQASFEERFPIYSFLNGALFADIGNIWLLNKNEDFTGGEFLFSEFYKQLALDAGIGLRFNFNFFVLRVDWALPLADPQKTESWFNLDDFSLRKGNWNFGIGYPF